MKNTQRNEPKFNANAQPNAAAERSPKPRRPGSRIGYRKLHPFKRDGIPTAPVVTEPAASVTASASVVHSNLHWSWSNPTRIATGDMGFITTKQKYGWMHCMSPHRLSWDGIPFLTAEHFFQWLRFKQYPEVQNEIREQKSPMTAKWAAAKHKDLLNRTGCWDESSEDIELMRLVLREKVEQNPELVKQLKATGTSRLIEDCTYRDRESSRFWGAVVNRSYWHGENVLGCLWMELRDQL